MPWQPVPRIAFAVATYPFQPSEPADLPLEIGDELYIIEETPDGNWLRGYLVAPPSLLAGLTSVKGQTLEARVFSGIFPRSCVEVREVLGEGDDADETESDDVPETPTEHSVISTDSPRSLVKKKKSIKSELALSSPVDGKPIKKARSSRDERVPTHGRLSVPIKREPDAPRPAAPVPMLKIGDETPTSVSEPLIDEIASCLREWHSTNLHGLLLARQYGQLDQLAQLMRTLNVSRQQLLHGVLTSHEYTTLREKTVWDLVRGNKLCGGEVIVRDPAERGRVLTGDDSVVEVTKQQAIMSLLDEPPMPVVESSALHHLLVDVKSFAGASTAETSLVFYLAHKPIGGFLTPLSETFVAEMPSGGQIGQARGAQLRTLFSDLTSGDIGEPPSAESELYLVVQVRSMEEVIAAKPSSRAGSVTQPFSAPKDNTKPPSSVGNKSVRRSLMWAGKTSRAFSRGNSKLGALSEQPEERPPTSGYPESRDGLPPSTATSRGTQHSSDMPNSSMAVERTVGVGVLKLNSTMKQDDEVEHVVTIWSPSARFGQDRTETVEDWSSILREIVDSSGQYEKSRRAERLQLHVRPFHHHDADALIRATPTILSGVTKTNKMGFAGAPSKPRSDIYVTIDEAMLSRQNLLSRYGGSATALPTSLHGSNIQITIEVRRSSGERIDNCIYPSSNTEGVTSFKTVAVQRGEPWKQTIRLQLAPQDVFLSHLVFHLEDKPHPPFAVTYMPLWEQQAFMKDGPHALLLYKIDEHTATPNPPPQGKGGYLSLPYTGRDKDGRDVSGPLAVLRVETFLCSTRFSQDRVILGLIRWKDYAREQVPDLLKQLIFVAEIEVVKLLNDVLDALFGILVEYTGNDEYEDLVFTALVRVLDIVHDRRFNLAPLVDQYAETKFDYPFATPCLVRSFTRLLVKPTEPETARKLRATFKVARHILKFITHARGQQREKEAGIGITSNDPNFARHLRSIFKALDAMMKNTAPTLVGSQTLAVQHFHTWLPELVGLLTTEEILHVAIDFMEACSGVKGKLVLYKLMLIINYSKLDVLGRPEEKSALCANTVRWIAPHWGATDEVTDQWKDQVRLCCSILASQVEYLGPEIPDYIPKIIESYLSIQATPRKPKSRLSLLFPTSYPFPSKPTTVDVPFDEALIELSAVLSALSNSPMGMQFELAEDDLHVIIENVLRVHRSILLGEAFPTSWLSVHIFHHKSTMRALHYLANLLLESFLPHPDHAEEFNTELWKLFFVTLLQLVGSASLALETFPEQKRRAVWKIAGDVREHGADLLRKTWEAIGWETSAEERAQYGLTKMGGYQVQYVPTLVGPIVELCLSVHEGLRKMAVEVLQTMILSEWTLSEDLSPVQMEMIDCLDVYFKTKPITESILQKLFVRELLDRFEAFSHDPEDPLYIAIRELMDSIYEFLDLLIAVHSADGSGEASHLIHRLRLMEFLRDMQKEEIFIRYVHQLATLQSDARNHTEAGLALRLHADLYDWDPTKTTLALQDPEFPSQSHFERKERIYFEMIKHFEEGQAWSSALAAYKELQHQYENNIFDYSKLARTERAIATIYETIAKSERLVPKYFRVIYKGHGFPTSLRDKQFVFEGSPTERTTAFTDRMQEQYPSAQIMTSEHIDDVEGQFLVITALSPHRDLTHHVFQRARVAHVVRDYLLASHPQTFSVTFKRSTTGHVSEHYAEKTIYETAETFPTILRRSEIVSTRDVRLSAKETAIERITRKTAEMTAVEKRIVDGEGNDELEQLLVDAISISVNPISENSVVCYRQLLPGMEPREDSESEEEEPVELDGQENAIKMALVDHAIMLRRCLAMFLKNGGTEALVKRLEELQKHFERTYAPEIAVLTPAQAVRDGPASLSPTWPRSPPSAISTPTVQQHGPKLSISHLQGTVIEEISAIQPLRQGRGARLSFLSGRRKDLTKELGSSPVSPATPNGDGFLNGHAEESVESRDRSRSVTKDNPNRLSFFRTHSGSESQQATNGHGSMSGANGTADWATDLGRGRASSDAFSDRDRENDQTHSVASSKVGSVRKRLSLLKLGGKKGRNDRMGALDEE